MIQMWVFFFVVVISCWANPVELKRVEQARFLYEMEGQSYRAIKILKSIDTSSSQVVLSRSQALLNEIESKLSNEKITRQSLPIHWSTSLNPIITTMPTNIDIGLGRRINKEDDGFYLMYKNQPKVKITDLHSQCSYNSSNSRFLYFICSNNQLVQINLNNPKVTYSNNFRNIIKFIPILYGGYIVTSDKVLKTTNLYSSEKIIFQGDQVLDARVTESSLIIRTQSKIIGMDKFLHKKKWVKNNVQGELIQHKNKFGIMHPNGYIQMFKESGEFLWRVHLGQPVLSHRLNQDTLEVSLKDGSFAQLDIENTAGYNHWELRVKELGSQNLFLIDSLLLVEPGNLTLWHRKVDNLQSKIGRSKELANALNVSLQLSREMNNPKSHLLEDYNQTIGAHWVRDLEISSSFYPQILNTSKGPTFIHSNTGQIHLFNPANGEDIIVSSDSIESTSPILEANKNKRFLYTIKQNKLQVRHPTTLELVKSHEFKNTLKALTPTPQGIIIEDWNNQISFYDLEKEYVTWKRNFNSSPLGTFYRTKQNTIITILNNGTMHVTDYKGKKSLKFRMRLGGIQFAKIQEDHLYLSDENHRIFQVSLDRMTVDWDKQMDSQVFSLQLHRGRVLVGLSNQRLVSLDVKSGRRLWQWDGRNSLFVKPSFYQNKVYLDQGSEMIILELQTGKKISGHYYPTEIGPPQVIANKLYLASRSGILHSFKLN